MNIRCCCIMLLECTLYVAGAAAGVEGWGFGAGAFDDDFGIQGRKEFTFTEAEASKAALQGSVFFHNRTTFRFDADYHHILNPGSPLRIYPLAGAEFSIQRKANRWGANLGGGLNLKLTEHNELFIEVKYVFGDWDGFGLMAGIFFNRKSPA